LISSLKLAYFGLIFGTCLVPDLGIVAIVTARSPFRKPGEPLSFLARLRNLWVDLDTGA
jgi:hypothetical protein